MGKLKSGFDGGKPTVGPQTNVTAENYSDRAKAFIATKGKDAEGFVVRSHDGVEGSIEKGLPSTEAQWRALMAYFDELGVKTVYDRERGMTTVPTQWPEDFDASVPLSDRRPVHAPTPAQRSPKAMIRRAAFDAAPPRPERRQDWEPEGPPPVQTPEQVAAEHAKRESPLLSDEARKVMGLPPLKKEAAE